MRPAAWRLIRGGAIGGVIALLVWALTGYLQGENDRVLEAVIVVATVVLVSVLVGATIALEASRRPKPPPVPSTDDTEPGPT